MSSNNKALTLRLHPRVVSTLRIVLLLGSLYFFRTTYGWMVFEKYQIGGNIRGIDAEVDKQLGLDKVTDLSLKYEQAWIDSEKKFNTTLGLVCLTTMGILSFFKPATD